MDTIDLTDTLFTSTEHVGTVLVALLVVGILGFVGMFAFIHGALGKISSVGFVVGVLGFTFGLLVAPTEPTPAGWAAIDQVIEFADSTCGIAVTKDEAELWLNSVSFDSTEAEDLKTESGVVAVDSVTETGDSKTVKLKCASFETAAQ